MSLQNAYVISLPLPLFPHLSSRNLWERLGNCYMHAEQKILFTNEMKRYRIWPRPKGWVQKIFQTLLPNFVKCHCKSWLNFVRFWMNESKQNEYKGLIMQNRKGKITPVNTSLDWIIFLWQWQWQWQWQHLFYWAAMIFVLLDNAELQGWNRSCKCTLRLKHFPLTMTMTTFVLLDNAKLQGWNRSCKQILRLKHFPLTMTMTFILFYNA
jgi:hypothetical protein